MAKVLITGLDGFTGLHLAQELNERGHDVCGIARKRVHGFAWPVSECDLLNREGLTEAFASEQPDALVHLAAVALVGHGDASAVYQTNIVGTRNLLYALVSAKCKPRLVLLASSAKVYGNSDQEVIDDAVVPAPTNDYASSKLATEYVAHLWKDKLPITIARPFNYAGVGQSKNFILPKIVTHFQERVPVIELENRQVIRDFSDVRNVVATYASLIEGSFAGQTFNVCSCVGHALKDILAMSSEITGSPPEVRVKFNFVRTNEVHKLIGNNGKLRRAIGGIPPIPLRDTLKWMLEVAA